MNFKEALIAHLSGEDVWVKFKETDWMPFGEDFGHMTINAAADRNHNEGYQFRLAPRTVSVNGVEVPAPETKMIRDGEIYFTPDVCSDDLFSRKCNLHPLTTKFHLERGLVYLNSEDAAARASAMLIIKEINVDKEQVIKEVLELVKTAGWAESVGELSRTGYRKKEIETKLRELLQ